MEANAIRITIFTIGGLLAWLLHLGGDKVGWFGGGILLGLGGMAIGLASVISVFVISVRRYRKNQEARWVSCGFIISSLGLLVFGASKMIAW